ncbi:MAG TPA: DNA mismatch repair protein MutS [Ktedonobacteraceae bacterium]|nr:DNA mismatch repair protein MutS [Ktedonobacteraceae bacterium]
MSTPARRQYLQMKSNYPDAILLYQVGDFYETFDEDARIAARELQIVLTARHYGDEQVPLAGVPLHALENYVGKLVARGYKVAICDQTSEIPVKGVVDRAVTRILTAGTLSEPNLLPSRKNNYLAAVAQGRAQTGLAAVDVSTGEFSVTWFSPEDLPAALEAELQRLAPAECLVLEGKRLSSFQLPAETMTVTPCPAYFFELEAAQARLCKLFAVHSLEAYGCAQAPQAIIAAGAIIAYLEKMNAGLLSLLTGLRSYQASSYMILDAHTQRNLDLLQGSRSGTAQGSLLGVLDRTITPMGARQLRRALTRPLLDLTELNARLESVEELYESPALRSRFTLFLQRFGDLERIAGRVRQGTAVPREVLGLREYLQMVPRLAELLRGCDAPLLHELIGRLDACPQVSDLIGQALTRNGDDDEQEGDGRLIRAGFHPELDELIASIRDSRRWMLSLEARERERTGITKLKVSFNKVFGYYIEVSNARLSQVPADYIRKQTLTNAERFITPDMKEHEALILSAEERIDELERSIYADVLRQLSAYYERVMQTALAIAQVDMLLSLSEVAAHHGYVRPRLDQEGGIDIIGGRHPVVEYTLDGDVFIPNDTFLEATESTDGARIVLLTGPNMAGKSTYLRQIALIVLLAQIGSFVPARSARLGLVDRIFTRVGAEDDIASGKSTFMVEMEETATILHHATRHSLIILDEIGRGTSTYDGLAIARAVVEYLHNSVGARTLFATHYHELAAMATELVHLRVYTVAISGENSEEIVFLHRVLPGSVGRSYGVHVARMAGMPASIVQRADVILKQLEAGRERIQPLLSLEQHNGHTPLIAEKRSNGLAEVAGQNYTWQSAQGHAIGQILVKGTDDFASFLDEIDVCAITPLDALNLLFAMQKQHKEMVKRKKNGERPE